MATDWVVRGNVRLTVEHFDDGWGWHAWECLTEDRWHALRPPAPPNARRRFMAQHEAEAFLLLLSEFIADTKTGDLWIPRAGVFTSAASKR